MIKKSILLFNIFLLLIVPLKAYGKKDAINIITKLAATRILEYLGSLVVYFLMKIKRDYISQILQTAVFFPMIRSLIIYLFYIPRET